MCWAANGPARGFCRPGAMERSVEGLTTKVLNELLRKLVRFEVLLRESYPEIPPRVECKLSPFGKKFGDILEAIKEFDNSMSKTNALSGSDSGFSGK